jgi:hypothetical protein
MHTEYHFSVAYPAGQYSMNKDQAIISAMKKVKAYETGSGTDGKDRDIGFSCTNPQAWERGIALARKMRLKLILVGCFVTVMEDKLDVTFDHKTGKFSDIWVWEG